MHLVWPLTHCAHRRRVDKYLLQYSRIPTPRPQMSDNQDSDERSEFARVNRVMLSKKSDEYRQRRERNNAAVKKSRHKSKQRTIETQKRVEQLKNENTCLERKLETLSQEFALMKDIFVPRRDLAQVAAPNQQQQQLMITNGQLSYRAPEIGQRLGYCEQQMLAQQQQQHLQQQCNENQQVTNVLNMQFMSKINE